MVVTAGTATRCTSGALVWSRTVCLPCLTPRRRLVPLTTARQLQLNHLISCNTLHRRPLYDGQRWFKGRALWPLLWEAGSRAGQLTLSGRAGRIGPSRLRAARRRPPPAPHLPSGPFLRFLTGRVHCGQHRGGRTPHPEDAPAIAARWHYSRSEELRTRKELLHETADYLDH